jgi:hypothetical protein
MLSRLLELLREGGTHRVSDLARELDTTPELVETMLEDLERMGHVKAMAAQCSEGCATCPMFERGCHLSPGTPGSSLSGRDSGKIWVLTEDLEAA